ncbi:MAG TPA: peptidoglycan-binding domain-containing protein [Acetobacteraceae bacterium]
MKASNLAALLALSSVAVLPACSMFGGGGGGHQASTAAPATQSYAASPNYNSSQARTSGAQSGELSPAMIRKVQQNLKQAGLYNARVDGVWGPQTEAAVRDYQQQHNMNATGELDQQTLDAMNLGTNNTNQSQNNENNGQQPSSQRYGSNYNPPPNSNTGQANYNPPPPNNANDQTNSGNNTNTTH